MRKTVIFLMSILAVLISCGSSAVSVASVAKMDDRPLKPLTPGDIAAAISQRRDVLIQSLPAGSRVAVLDMEADGLEIAIFTTEEIIKTLVTARRFRVLDRDSVETLRKERDFQMSGEVDDKTAVSIGKFIGASVVITGALYQRSGGQSDISLKILDVETTEIIDLISLPILN